MKLDILAFGAHPDDVEMSCIATLMKHASLGYKFGIIDITRGELGTRGTAEDRDAEAAAAAIISGASIRDNLMMRDSFFQNDEKHQLEIIKVLRKYQPEIVFANAIADRHPDHGKAALLVRDACFLSGLMKIETHDDSGKPQNAWRPKTVYHYIQDKDLVPDFLVDVSEFTEKKFECIHAFRSQFYDKDNQTEPATYISKPEFLDTLRGRMLILGKHIGVKYAEGFMTNRFIGLHDLMKVK